MKFLIRDISAEFLKLKGTYVWWLFALVIGFIAFIIFMGHYVDVNSIARFGIDPWKRISMAGQAIFSMFIIGLYVTLLTGAGSFIENKASGWKLLFAYPKRRSSIFYTKLITYLLILILLSISLSIILYLVGQLLDLLRPEYEIAYYAFDIKAFLSSLMHSLISVLGVLGIHYFLSLAFKNFIIPVGIGVVGFILGLILSTMNTPNALYCPYSYPMVVKDFDMFRIDNIGIQSYGFLNSVEVNSILIFIVFVVLANIMMARKNVV